MRAVFRSVMTAVAASACAVTLLASAGAAASPQEAQKAQKAHKSKEPSVRRVTQGANGPSGDASVSANGRYVVFESSADNLVPGDTNGAPDVFLHDLRTRRTVRAGLTADGGQAPYGGSSPVISADGRYVVFRSRDLIRGQEQTGYFRRDLGTGATDWVGGADDLYPGEGALVGASVSADGRYVSFTARQTRTGRPGHRTAVRDLATGGLTVLDSPYASEAHLSDDGRRLVYWESVPAPVSYPPSRVFVLDLRTGQSRRLDVAADGSTTTARSGHPAVSGNGRVAAFASWATDLVPGEDPNGARDDVFVADLRTGALRRLEAPAAEGHSTLPSLSGDGRYVVFGFTPPGVSWGTTHLYRTDLRSGRTTPVSRTADGTPAAATTGERPVDAHGRTVVFSSADGALAPGAPSPGGDVYVRTMR
ncbi:Tol-Pal system protein TolB [Streptomyces sp. enrichment culture]|uniref:TolB family protein n=1 Tax=Streptomyces sp. enrichment culture TaxID=1795815 RepID=UPI003F54BDBE